MPSGVLCNVLYLSGTSFLLNEVFFLQYRHRLRYLTFAFLLDRVHLFSPGQFPLGDLALSVVPLASSESPRILDIEFRSPCYPSSTIFSYLFHACRSSSSFRFRSRLCFWRPAAEFPIFTHALQEFLLTPLFLPNFRAASTESTSRCVDVLVF